MSNSKIGVPPSYNVKSDGGVYCPWCKNHQFHLDQASSTDGNYECGDCGKGFSLECDSHDGPVYTLGRLTDADREYLKWKAERDAQT